MRMTSLAGKTAVITGSSRGISGPSTIKDSKLTDILSVLDVRRRARSLPQPCW
jgi:hypothetical protein